MIVEPDEEEEGGGCSEGEALEYMEDEEGEGEEGEEVGEEEAGGRACDDEVRGSTGRTSVSFSSRSLQIYEIVIQ